MSMARILVAEDEDGIAFALQTDLQAEGYEVTVVDDGLDAVSCARSERFDVVLLDIMLPGKDGFEVCRELRRSGTQTRVILLTARAHAADRIVGLDVGADDYVTKPFSPRDLRARVRALLPGAQRVPGSPGEVLSGNHDRPRMEE